MGIQLIGGPLISSTDIPGFNTQQEKQINQPNTQKEIYQETGHKEI